VPVPLRQSLWLAHRNSLFFTRVTETRAKLLPLDPVPMPDASNAFHTFLPETRMTTLAQDLFYQTVRRGWRGAMNECLTECRRVSLVR
jgi:hypothetical protein